jgi:hypothetical protein
MTGIGIRAIALALCVGAVGCTTYNPATGTYETDPVGTSLVAGGLGMAGGVALGAALSDHDDCCWGGGWGGYHNDVNVYNNYNRTANYNKNVNYNKNKWKGGNANRSNWGGGGGGGRAGGGGGWGGGARGGGRGGGGRGGGGRGGGRR